MSNLYLVYLGSRATLLHCLIRSLARPSVLARVGLLSAAPTPDFSTYFTSLQPFRYTTMSMFMSTPANPYDDVVGKSHICHIFPPAVYTPHTFRHNEKVKATDETLTGENWEIILNLCDKVQDEGDQGSVSPHLYSPIMLTQSLVHGTSSQLSSSALLTGTRMYNYTRSPSPSRFPRTVAKISTAKSHREHSRRHWRD